MEKLKFDVVELIGVKRDGNVLTKDQIYSFVDQVAKNAIHDGQLGAMLMAIYLNGMSSEEVIDLTVAMVKTGETLCWPEDWKPLIVDKHSTGGVGDKVSLILAPALAACGLKVPMISGRSLGFTGGTLDKMESIPGYRIHLSPAEIFACLANVGCCIVGQTETLAPADKKMFAMRDVTNTVPCKPLIVSSIISKKAAEGLNCLLLDVKAGRGAFCKTQEEAQSAASALVSASEGLGIKTVALVTEMDEPIGYFIGNSLEVLESVSCLQGNGPDDILSLVIEQGGWLLYLQGMATTVEDGKMRIAQAIREGSALDKFAHMLMQQGVAESVVRKLLDPSEILHVLPISKFQTRLSSTRSGVVVAVDSLICGEVSSALGSGRLQPSDVVAHDTGLQLAVKVGQIVTEGEVWVTVYHKENAFTPVLKEKLESALRVDPSAKEKLPTSRSRILSVVPSKLANVKRNEIAC